MAYGDLPLDAPEKPNKGQEGGACNRRSCQAEPALWWNHGSYSWYCEDCANDIGQDIVNRRSWMANFHRYFPHQIQFPMFETRDMMDEREVLEQAPPATVAPRQQGKTEALAQQYASERRWNVCQQPPESRQVRRARERAERKAIFKPRNLGKSFR
jgi:hypothetical protein